VIAEVYLWKAQTEITCIAIRRFAPTLEGFCHPQTPHVAAEAEQWPYSRRHRSVH
jgi:hypothetical protein